MRALLFLLVSLVAAPVLAEDSPDSSARRAAGAVISNVVRLEGPGGVSRRGLPLCGVILGDRGVVVTIMRLGVPGSRTVVRLPGGRAIRAEILVRDPVSDITALKLDEPVGGGLAASSADLPAGSPVQMAGYGFGVLRGFGTAAVGTGVVAQAQVRTRYLLSSAVNPGDAGGALVDAEGRFAGLLLPDRDPLTGLSTAAPISMIRKLLSGEEILREALAADGNSRPGLWPVHASLSRVARDAWPAVLSLMVDDRLVGSAFLIDAKGRAVTNRVGDPKNLKAFLSDGREVAVVVLGEDERFDIAVLQVRGENLPVPLTLGKELPAVGTFVVAVGNPNGKQVERGPLLSVGIVGAQNRSDRRFGALHTDAAVNRGNLGGPLLDLEGRVVGVLSSLAGESIREVGVNSGIGYAIPIATLLPRLDALRKGESISFRPGYLGVTLDLDVVADGGIRIATVLPEHAAYRGGLRAGDVILEANGEGTKDLESARRVFTSLMEGAEVVVVVRRGEETLTLTVVLGPWPREAPR